MATLFDTYKVALRGGTIAGSLDPARSVVTIWHHSPQGVRVLQSFLVSRKAPDMEVQQAIRDAVNQEAAKVPRPRR